MKEKILIIWAGPAGLTLWFELLSRAPDAYEIIIVDKDIIVWGLAQTYNHKGNRIDIGGHRFFSKNKRVMDRWFSQMPLQGEWASDYKQLGIQSEVKTGGPDPDKEDLVMLARRRLSKILALLSNTNSWGTLCVGLISNFLLQAVTNKTTAAKNIICFYIF